MTRFIDCRPGIRFLTGLFLLAAFSPPAFAVEACNELLDYRATKLRSTQQIDFCEAFAGKALLVVNTASQCGFTPQFKGLEQLHKTYGDRLAIVGFPSDDFNQEYEDTEKIGEVCYLNYGVTFTMLEPSKVKGDAANAIFKKLADRTGQQPSWNFNKYLISADGGTVRHFDSRTLPGSKNFRQSIDDILAQK